MEWTSKAHLSLFFYLLPTILVCVVATLLLMRKRARGTCHKSPPGPRVLPIIGHLHLLGKLPHRSLYNLSKVHGPLMSLRLGTVPIIVASTPAMARQILQTHDQEFADRPRTAAIFHLSSGCKNISFSSPNSYWRLMRQLCVTDVFSNKRVESFRSVRAEEVGALMRSVLAEGVEAPFAVRPKLLTATNHIISRMVLGMRLSEVAPTNCSSQSIAALLNEASHLVGVFNLGDYIPFLAWMDLQGCVRRSKVVAEKLGTVLQEVIDRRRRDKRTDGWPSDLLDVLLGAAASSRNVEIRDDNIKAVLLDMVAAGTDTSSITVEWALAELLLNPEKMKIVQGEIDSVIGRTRTIQELDIPHLPYLQAVVKETMRLHPVAPLLIPHMSNKPCQILDFEIPPNTQAYVNVWAIGRDPNAWEKPEEFWPERFLDNIIDTQGQHFQLLPFGSGRRGCPGWSLGRLNVQIMLASLLQGFECHISGELDLSETFRLTVMTAKPLLISVIPRLAINLYTKWP